MIRLGGEVELAPLGPQAGVNIELPPVLLGILGKDPAKKTVSLCNIVGVSFSDFFFHKQNDAKSRIIIEFFLSTLQAPEYPSLKFVQLEYHDLTYSINKKLHIKILLD